MQILEHIKSLDLTINENVYAALITGHARANDIASAEKLLYEMRDQITPGLLSFTALLCAYAERGDMGSINKVSPWEGEGGEREREGRGDSSESIHMTIQVLYYNCTTFLPFLSRLVVR